MQYGYTMMDASQRIEPFCAGKIFLDQRGDESRPGFRQLLHTLRKGDTVTIPSLSCLGSTLLQLSVKWEELTDKEVSVSILDFPELKTGDRHFSRLMDYLLDTDRQMRRKKQVNGMQRARDGGKRLGRKPKAIPDRFGEVYGSMKRAVCQPGMPRVCWMSRTPHFCAGAAGRKPGKRSCTPEAVHPGQDRI